jgi:Flp pilus assembly pilin Flp
LRIAFARLLRDDDGAAIVEYGIILAGISLSSIVALQMMGISINSLYSNLVANWTSSANSGQ